MAENIVSNNTLFYNSLVQGLLRPDVRYMDAHYLDVTLPADGAFEGGKGWMSDYPDFLLKAARDLREQQRQINIAKLEAGDMNFIPDGLTQKDRRSFLMRGLAFIDVELKVGEGQEAKGCMTVCPQDVPENDHCLRAAIRAGLEPIAEEPFVYDPTRELYIPDPFEEPHLLALYKYLTS